MMSETDADAPATAPDTGDTDAPGRTHDVEQYGGVDSVLDALTPLTDSMDRHAGFAVTYARTRRPRGDAMNPRLVEVRFYLGERDPREVDRARGMLQGHGYEPVKERRGPCVFLAIPVCEDGTPRDVDREPRGSAEQTVLDLRRDAEQ